MKTFEEFVREQNEKHIDEGYRNIVGSRYESGLSVGTIAKKIKEYVKKTHPKCKFSVVVNHYTEIQVCLMEANFEAFIKTSMKNKQLYGSKGVIMKDNDITDDCKIVLSDVSDYVNSYMRDDSDVMTDYFDVNFYFTLEVGKWNREFINNSK